MATQKKKMSIQKVSQLQHFNLDNNSPNFILINVGDFLLCLSQFIEPSVHKMFS